jgi:glyoxylase I family protein
MHEGVLAETQMLRSIHHVALICSDYAVSKRFYTECLGLQIISEHYRVERQSWKLDLALPDGAQLELFSFTSPPKRVSQPEACGLRHLAFAVDDTVEGEARSGWRRRRSDQSRPAYESPICVFR